MARRRTCPDREAAPGRSAGGGLGARFLAGLVRSPDGLRRPAARRSRDLRTRCWSSCLPSLGYRFAVLAGPAAALTAGPRRRAEATPGLPGLTIRRGAG